jgi:choloylglycine hydrolase
LNHSDYTQWALIKDVTNKKLYYRSYNNLSLRSIDLTKTNWNAAASNSPIAIDEVLSN